MPLLQFPGLAEEKDPETGMYYFGLAQHFFSYNWDSQKQVLAIKQALQAHGIRCWMDVDGGMKQDIYDSMATAVQNAKVVCCFMTAKYQASANCRLELKVS